MIGQAYTPSPGEFMLILFPSHVLFSQSENYYPAYPMQLKVPNTEQDTQYLKQTITMEQLGIFP